MRTKFNVILTLMLALVVQLSFAQGKVITGVVTDAGNGEPLPGVNIVVKGTQTGATTDFDGKYTIKANAGQTLVFSYVGYNAVERAVGNASVINVKMSEDKTQLETVVINALGVEVKKATEKGVAVSKVKAKVLESTGETNPVAALSGKISGVKIDLSSGDPGASSNIQIRGPKSIILSNKPLFVIDGFPVYDGIYGSNVDGVERPSKISDIDPNIIESVKILKGGAAAALWGSKAANGVVLITTKHGKTAKNGKFNISITSTYSNDRPLTRYQLQDKFGKGKDGVYNPGSRFKYAGSWGDKISDRDGGDDDIDTVSGEYFLDQNGKKWYPILVKKSKEVYNDKNYNAVIGIGSYWKNNVNLSSSSNTGSFFLSLNNLQTTGIFKNSYFDQTGVKINASLKPTKKITVKGNFNYIYSKQNAIQKGSNLSGLLLGLYRTPADFDNSGYIGERHDGSGNVILGSHRSYRKYLGTGYKQSPSYNNPLFTVYKQENPWKSNHFLAGSEVNYDVFDALTLILKGGIDNSTDNSITYFPINSGENPNGSYTDRLFSRTIINSDLMAHYYKNITDDLNLDLIIGTNFYQRKSHATTAYYTDFLINTDVPTAQNATSQNKKPRFGTTIVRKNAGYGSATLNYKDLVYTTLTSRAERSSTYSGMVIYPSASIAFDVSKLPAFKDNDILSTATIRANWSKVGNAPNPYLINTYYVSASGSNGWGDSWSASAYDGSIWLSRDAGNPDIKPEITTETEFGLDLSLLKHRINLTATYYNSDSHDLLLWVKQAPSSVGSYKMENAAEMTNKGIELEINGKIIQKNDFDLSIGGTYSKNKNNVTNLAGSEYIGLNGFTSTSSGVAEGYAYGILRTGDFKKDSDGNLVLDSNGFPVSGKKILFGDPNPDFRYSAFTEARYKRFKLKVLFDASVGGQAWDGTTGALTHFGRTLETANEVTLSAADAATVVNYSGTPVNSLPNVVANSDGTYTVRGNLKDFGNGNVLLDQDWYTTIGGGFGPIGTQFFKDATWAKLREVSLNYSFSPDFLKKTKIKTISFGITGRNLFLWTKDKSWQIDPETNLSGASRGRGLQYFNHPTTKSYVFTTTINF